MAGKFIKIGQTSGITGVISSFIGYINALIVGKFNSTKPSLLDGQGTEAQMTSRGALLVAQDELPQAQDDTNRVIAMRERPFVDSTYGWLLYKSTALETSAVVKVSAGMLSGYDIRIDSTAPSATYYVQILNSATVPVDGAVTHLIAPIKVIHTVGFDDYVLVPWHQAASASAGIAYCLSSTEFTKTLSGAYLSATFWGA